MNNQKDIFQENIHKEENQNKKAQVKRKQNQDKGIKNV